jgi:glycosyltransferase involved in cell wall biosynthesis
MKILYAIDDSVESIKKYIAEGNEYPKTYFWWDFTDDNPKYELYFIDNNKPRKGILRFIEIITGIRNLPFQIEILRKQKEYDVIFCSLDYFFFLVVFFRYLGIIKKPIFGKADGSFNSKFSVQKWYWKLRSRFFSYITMNGLDYIAFVSEIALNKASEVHKISKNNNHILHWGPDLNFYDNYNCPYLINQELYFMSIGSTNRDYKLLINVFNSLSYKLNIFQKFDDLNIDNEIISDNIEFDKELRGAKNLHRHTFIRKAYKECFAVLIPLEKQYDSPQGITCLLEAMACNKPVIVTDNILFPFDVEKEGVGIKVAYGDKEGWIKAINYLINNKDIAKKMGENGYKLIKTQRNYDIYKNELLRDFDLFIEQNNIKGKI